MSEPTFVSVSLFFAPHSSGKKDQKTFLQHLAAKWAEIEFDSSS
jgi:hypothetical protein